MSVRPNITFPVLFMCHTGVVRSSDGQEHIISCHDLPRLYGIPASMCRFINDTNDLRGFTEDYLKQMVHLFPRSNGDYSHVPQQGEVENEQ